MAEQKKKRPGLARGYSHVCRKRRSKADWSGIGVGDAFKMNLDYYLRMPAQRTYYKMVRKAQLSVASLDDNFSEASFQPGIKPQLGPFYTTYPSTIAAHASIGLTAFLEFKAFVGESILFFHLRDYLDNPAEVDGIRVNADIYKDAANTITDCVQTRLLLENLSRIPSLSSVELYRLFSASQQDLRFASLPEIIRVVILYGDVITDFRGRQLYPLTRSIIEDLTAASAVFFEKLRKTDVTKFIELGALWVRKACVSLSGYLPPPDENNESESTLQAPSDSAPERKSLLKKIRDRLDSRPDMISTDGISPLNFPQHPLLSNPEDAFNRISQGILTSVLKEGRCQDRRGKTPDYEEPVREALKNFSCAMEKAGMQENSWEDMRSDLVEVSMRSNDFKAGPIQGNPADGNEVRVPLGDGEVTGEIFDRPVDLSEDTDALDALIGESMSITESLRRELYPSFQMTTETRRLRCSGSIDPSRIVLVDFSPAVFKRYRTVEQVDLRGRPVLVIACDGSGSLNARQMRMVKVLASGWLRSTAGSEIRVLAGLYHSDTIRQGLSGPIVQWIYHPLKSRARSRTDAVRAVVTLPDTGTGVQSDALSISFIVEEARLLAKSDMVYLILVSDTQWNSSFNRGISGADEVHSYFESAYESMKGKLHTTLVALGVSGETGFEDILDRVIAVSEEELDDSAAVAKKIGSSVAACMKERSKLNRS